MGEDYLNATIRYKDKEIDIRFSKTLSLQEVKELMCSNDLDKLLSLRQSNWYLDVQGKLLLKEYPLGNGDVLEVIIND